MDGSSVYLHIDDSLHCLLMGDWINNIDGFANRMSKCMNSKWIVKNWFSSPSPIVLGLAVDVSVSVLEKVKGFTHFPKLIKYQTRLRDCTHRVVLADIRSHKFVSSHASALFWIWTEAVDNRGTQLVDQKWEWTVIDKSLFWSRPTSWMRNTLGQFNTSIPLQSRSSSLHDPLHNHVCVYSFNPRVNADIACKTTGRIDGWR